MTDNIETWPKKIYLLTDDEFDHVPEYEAVQGINEDGIFWCSHTYTNNDVEYVRKDLFDSAYEQGKKDVACAINALIESHIRYSSECTHANCDIVAGMQAALDCVGELTKEEK